ncbi:MAG: aminotransferase class I/II-fold pyridoxal phosphate-dependent enzyme [candidate division Zixibacteria bacterium]|nr:aminotransferase class I/II-fold pyridoxal phosphate-dependent enzyme [candidate division Zixibacteria bacterium]
MEKRLVKVVPSVLDLEEPEQDFQGALLAPNEETLLKLDQNEATVSPSPLVLKALKSSLETKALNCSPDIGSRKLRRKLSHYMGVNFDSIACYANPAAAMETIVRTYLQPGLEMLNAWPTDSPFSHYAVSTGAKVINIKFKDQFRPKVEEIIGAKTSKTRLIYLANPSGISGASLTEAELVFLLSYAENSMVVVDEAYFEFCGTTVADIISSFPNLIVLRTFSKGFALAGFDICCLTTDSRNFKFLNKLGYLKGPNTLAQVAAEAALEDLSYTSELVRQVSQSKKLLFDSLTCRGYDFRITSANFFLMRVADPDGLVKSLADKNVFVNCLEGIPGFENYVRITIGTPQQTSIVLDILGRLAPEQAISSTTDRKDVKPVNRLHSSLKPGSRIVLKKPEGTVQS